MSLDMGEMYGAHHAAVWAFVRRRVVDYHLAEDITSETFIRAWKGAAGFEPRGGGVAAWLQAIARNLIYDHAKSGYRRRELLAGPVNEDFGPYSDPADPAPGPAELVVRREDNAKTFRVMDELLSAIGRLTGGQREAMLHRHVDGLSIGDTAALMGKSSGAVKALCVRATVNVTRHLMRVTGQVTR